MASPEKSLLPATRMVAGHGQNNSVPMQVNAESSVNKSKEMKEWEDPFLAACIIKVHRPARRVLL